MGIKISYSTSTNICVGACVCVRVHVLCDNYAFLLLDEAGRQGEDQQGIRAKSDQQAAIIVWLIRQFHLITIVVFEMILKPS